MRVFLLHKGFHQSRTTLHQTTLHQTKSSPLLTLHSSGQGGYVHTSQHPGLRVLLHQPMTWDNWKLLTVKTVKKTI